MSRPTLLRRDPAGVALAIVVAFLAGAPFAPAQERRDTGVASAPYPEASLRSNVGVFVGVNQFTEDSAAIRALDHGVDDAVAMAYLFVLELKLFSPKRTYLALGGEPTSPAARGQLDALLAAGAVRDAATKPRLLRRLAEGARAAASADDLLLAYFATHGIEGHERKPYLVPSDGIREFLDDTGLAMTRVQEILDLSPAGKRVVILDSCRSATRTRGSATPSGDFIEALKNARGAAILTSCSSRQVAHEASAFGHGAYTHFLMEALRGGAPADENGIIRLGAVHDTTRSRVRAWAESQGLEVQEPDLGGEVAAARAIPLAIDPRRHAEVASFRAAVSALGPRLRARIEPNGAFGYREAERIERALAAARPDDMGRGMVELCESFLAGRQTGTFFASYVNALPDGTSKRVPPWATLVRADPDPLLVTDPTALASLRSLDLAWRVRDTKTGIEMLLVPPGSYLRGSPDTEAGRSADEGPQHRVTFTKPFYLGVYEVTNAQYRKHHKADHDSGAYEGLTLNGDEQPVVRVSYLDAMAFCKVNGFELPSEAQWEYAGRGGTTTAYPWGDDPAAGGGWANACDATANRKFPAWSWPAFPWDDGFDIAAPVGRFRANGFGFHDMIGNAWEVLADAYLEKAYSDCAAGVMDPTFIVGDSRSIRVWRGGSWYDVPRNCRAASRSSDVPSGSDHDGGFRVSRTP